MAQPTKALHTRSHSPEMAPGHERLDHDPRYGEGFLIDTGIASVELLSSESRKSHSVQLDRYTMEDGHAYEVEFAQPADSRSDTAIASTTPWLVGRKGFNTKINSQFNDMGYPTIFVSPIDSALGANLRDSAHNMNHIIRHRLHESDLRPNEVLGYGSSRAAAIALGLKDMAYADVLAPCFPRGTKLEELPGNIIQAGFEAAELGKHIARIGLLGISRQHKTFSSDPADWLHYLRVIPHLWNGDAGRLAHTSKETPTHLTVLDKDGWSQPHIWQQMASDRPKMSVKIMEGRHLSLTHPKVLEGPFTRFDMLAEMRGFDGSFEDVDFGEVMQIEPAEHTKSGLLGRLSVGSLLKAA